MGYRRALQAALVGGACCAAIVSVGVPLASGSNDDVKVAAANPAPGTPIYLDRRYSYAERAADLVSRMTTAEKASQLISSQAPGIPRLGIRPWGQWNEALHGVSRSQLTYNANATLLNNTTSYPTDQTMGSSWDPDLMYRVASAIGDEAREVSPDNVSNLDFYSPTMNLERDPRWGRTDESYGEDPFQTARMVSQFVNGMEGKDESGKLLPSADGYYKTLTTIKHYAANNSEVNRLNGSSNMDDRTLREYYTAAFRDVVRSSHPGSVMSSYNSVNGTAQPNDPMSITGPNNPAGAPASSDPYLIDTLMRETFGFDGYVTSDCDAVERGTNSHHWAIPNWPSPLFARPVNTTERNALAQSAGEDSECNTGYHDNYDYLNRLPAATRDQIKTLVDSYTVNDLDAAAVRVFTSRMKLGEFDEPSLNPWVRQARQNVPEGSWTNDNSNNAVTETPARLALAHEAADKTIVLLKNSGGLLPLHVPATGAPKIAVIGLLACPAATVSGQATTCPSAANVYLGGYSSNQAAAGQSNIVTGYDGIKRAVQAINPNATVDLWRGFTDGTNVGNARTVDPAAIQAAGGYDEAVVYVGTDQSTADEAADRSSLTLPGSQETLINQVAAANPHTAVYMETVGPMDVSAWEGNVPAILWSSYNGQRKGEALADVLLGKYDPSGRLPSTWYAQVSDLPPITDYALRPTATTHGRTYMYYDDPAHPVRYHFGYGLSYTHFAYSNVTVDRTSLDANDTFNVSFDVTNDGGVAGTDTPQLYVTTPGAQPSAQRPIKRLRGFQKVTLDPQQTKHVTLTVHVPDLAFFDQSAGKWVVDPGQYGIQIAQSSADSDVVATKTVTVSGTLTPTIANVDVKPAMAGDDQREIVDRIQFPEGAEIKPNVTVAMSDDTLYGFVRYQRDLDKNSADYGKLVSLGHALPSGMTVTYSSNRPGVVRADGNRLVAVANGVATLTATVRYHGEEKSRDFVVKVASLPTDLTLNGRSIGAAVPGTTFAPDVFTYDVIVPDATTSAPQVGVDAPRDAQVVVNQAGGVPGTAQVAVTGPEGDTATYTVHFAHPAQTDEFTSGVAGPQWHWIRKNVDMQNRTAGALQINTEAGDIVSTPTTTTNDARNLLLQPALGDWTAETKIDLNTPLSANGQQVGMVAYQDDDNYLKFVLAYGGNPAAPQLTVISEDNRSCCDPGYAQGSGPVSETLATPRPADITGSTKTIWLRMTKQGARYRMWYSTDGSTFTPVYETGAPLEDVNVGLFAVGGTTVRASYDYFRISGQSQPASIPALAGPPVTPPPTSGTPQGPRPDRTRPLLWLHSGRVQSLKALRTRGLRFRVSANERLGTLEATLWVRFASHGKRHVAVRLARQTLHGVKARQVVTLVLRPSAKLRRRLSTQGRLPGLLRIRATDVAGNRSTRTKPLVFH